MWKMLFAVMWFGSSLKKVVKQRKAGKRRRLFRWNLLKSTENFCNASAGLNVVLHIRKAKDLEQASSDGGVMTSFARKLLTASSTNSLKVSISNDIPTLEPPFKNVKTLFGVNGAPNKNWSTSKRTNTVISLKRAHKKLSMKSMKSMKAHMLEWTQSCHTGAKTWSLRFFQTLAVVFPGRRKLLGSNNQQRPCWCHTTFEKEQVQTQTSRFMMIVHLSFVWSYQKVRILALRNQNLRNFEDFIAQCRHLIMSYSPPPRFCPRGLGCPRPRGSVQVGHVVHRHPAESLSSLMFG